jgi:hypothetical protein
MRSESSLGNFSARVEQEARAEYESHSNYRTVYRAFASPDDFVFVAATLLSVPSPKSSGCM